MKLKEKDALLVTGPAHYEKALVDSVLKGNKYKLNNGMTIDKNLILSVLLLLNLRLNFLMRINIIICCQWKEYQEFWVKLMKN